jgi:hypothetical protein
VTPTQAPYVARNAPTKRRRWPWVARLATIAIAPAAVVALTLAGIGFAAHPTHLGRATPSIEVRDLASAMDGPNHYSITFDVRVQPQTADVEVTLASWPTSGGGTATWVVGCARDPGLAVQWTSPDGSATGVLAGVRVDDGHWHKVSVHMRQAPAGTAVDLSVDGRIVAAGAVADAPRFGAAGAATTDY